MPPAPIGSLGSLCLRAGGTVAFARLMIRFRVGFPGSRFRVGFPLSSCHAVAVFRSSSASPCGALFIWCSVLAAVLRLSCGRRRRLLAPLDIESSVHSSRYCIPARGAGVDCPVRRALSSVDVPVLRLGSGRVESRIAHAVPFRSLFCFPYLLIRVP